MRARLGPALFSAVVLVFGLDQALSQDLATYRRVLGELASSINIYPSVILEECELFLDAYPLSDSLYLPLELYAITASGMDNADWARASLYLVKSKLVYDSPTPPERLALTFDRCIALSNRYLVTRSFSAKQTEALRRALFWRPKSEAKSRRSLRYLSLLHDICSKSTVSLFLQEFDWYLRNFPSSLAIDTVRFWLAELYMMKGKHRQAAMVFLSIPMMVADSPLAQQAFLRSAAELRSSPVWDFKAAISVLERAKAVLPDTAWRPLLEMEVEIVTDNLHDIGKGWELLGRLVSRFPDSYTLREKTFRKLISSRIDTPFGGVDLVSVARRYLRLYPLTSFARTLRERLPVSDAH